MTMYERIKDLREKKEMTQQELAEKVGYKTGSAINKIELGLRDLNQTKIRAFAIALGTTVSYLMDGEEPVNQTTIGFEDGVVDLDTGITYTDEQWNDLCDNFFSIKIEQRQNIEFKCFLTDTQKELLISMIKSWGVECYERKEGKNV